MAEIIQPIQHASFVDLVPRTLHSESACRRSLAVERSSEECTTVSVGLNERLGILGRVDASLRTRAARFRLARVWIAQASSGWKVRPWMGTRCNRHTVFAGSEKKGGRRKSARRSFSADLGVRLCANVPHKVTLSRIVTGHRSNRRSSVTLLQSTRLSIENRIAGLADLRAHVPL